MIIMTIFIEEPIFWHVAFAVADVEAAMADLGPALRLDWRPVKRWTGTMRDAGGRTHAIRTRITYSATSPLAIELFEDVPGSPLARRGGNPFHHIGFWTDDPAAERRRLADAGWPCAGSAAEADGPVRSLFSGSDLGVWIEACNVAVDRRGLRDLYPAAFRSPAREPLE